MGRTQCYLKMMDALEDKPMDQSPPTQPEKVKTAIISLYISLVLGVVRGIWEMYDSPDIPSPLIGILIACFVVGLLCFIVYNINRGYNWARLTFLILFLIGTPFAISQVVQDLANHPITARISVAQIVLQAIALVFLYLKRSSTWFREMKRTSPE